jgi:hypothetical protein
MRISFHVQFSGADPFQIERHHATQGLVDAEGLFEFHRLAAGVPVAHHIEDSGYFALQIFWFVEERGRIEAGHNLVAKFSQAIAFARRQVAKVFELRSHGYPFLGPAVEDNVVEHVLTQAIGLFCPLLRGGRRGELRGVAEDVLLQLVGDDLPWLQGRVQNLANVIGVDLRTRREWGKKESEAADSYASHDVLFAFSRSKTVPVQICNASPVLQWREPAFMRVSAAFLMAIDR